MKFIMITFSHSQLNIFRKQFLFKKQTNLSAILFQFMKCLCFIQKGYIWSQWDPLSLEEHCCSHTYYPQQPWTGCCWESAVWQKICSTNTKSNFKKSLMLVKYNQMILLDYYFMINRQFTLQHLMQPSHSMFPVVSLMVRSDTNAGYSVSHGTIMVLPRDLWAERETEQV